MQRGSDLTSGDVPGDVTVRRPWRKPNTGAVVGTPSIANAVDQGIRALCGIDI